MMCKLHFDAVPFIALHLNILQSLETLSLPPAPGTRRWHISGRCYSQISSISHTLHNWRVLVKLSVRLKLCKQRVNEQKLSQNKRFFGSVTLHDALESASSRARLGRLFAQAAWPKGYDLRQSTRLKLIPSCSAGRVIGLRNSGLSAPD